MILKTKIITVITLVLLLTIGTSTVVVLNVHNRKMMTADIKDVEILSNIIARSIEDAMEQGKTDDVQRILENIGKGQEIIDLRIISNDGYILKSKRPEEINTRSKEYTLTNIDDIKYGPVFWKNSINNMQPILNRKQCHGCHSEDIKYNGIIQIKYDVSRSRTDMVAIKRFLILSNIVTVLVVAGIFGYIFTKLIMRPVKSLLNTINSAERGNWDARVDVSNNDELGTVGLAFNRMLQEIKKLYDKDIRKEKEISKVKVELDHKRKLEELNAQLQYKVKEVETANKAVLSLSKEVKSKNIELEKMVERLKKINDVGRIMTSIIETDELLKLIIKTSAELLRAEKGTIYLIKDEKQQLALQYLRGIGIENITSSSIDYHPMYNEIINEGKSVFVGQGSSIAAGMDQPPVPAMGVPLKMKGQIVGGMLLEQKLDNTLFTSDELEILSTIANQAMVAIENAWLYETVKSNYFGTIQSLINALEANDKYTRGHSERVRALAVETARYIGFDYRELEILEHAAILHDIGKIGVDSVVLNKAGKLSSAEFSLIKAHPIIGDEILGPIGTLQGVRTTILQHHERYDGTGYPYGIAGDEISLKARILSIVDTFDAMLTDRPYRKALPLGKAKEELRLGGGSQFDPMLVEAFLEMLDGNESLLTNVGYSS